MSYHDDEKPAPKSAETLPRITRLGTFWAFVFYCSILVTIFVSIDKTELRLTGTAITVALLVIPAFGMWRGYRRDSAVDQNISYLRAKNRELELKLELAKHKTDETMLTIVLAHLPVLWAIFAAETPQYAHDRSQFTIWLIGYVNRPGYNQVWRNSFYSDMDLPGTEQLDFEAMVHAAADMAFVKGYLRHGADLPD